MTDPSDERPINPPMPNLLKFTPERWGEVERFGNFYSETYKLDDRERRAMSGISGHFLKARQFHDWALQLAQNLEIDENELNENGFTPAIHSHRLSAVIEATVTELYATIDCCVQILRAIYGPTSQGFKKDTTTALYWYVDKITGSFPEALKALFRVVPWYSMLRKIRSEIAHLSVGNCHLDRQTRKVNYFIDGVLPKDKPPYIDDIFAWLEQTEAGLNTHLGQIFGYLNSTLSATPVATICGMTEGRMLMRHVIPSDPLDFNNGICIAWPWFEKDENPTCPFVSACGAYKRAKGFKPEADTS